MNPQEVRERAEEFSSRETKFRLTAESMHYLFILFIVLCNVASIVVYGNILLDGPGFPYNRGIPANNTIACSSATYPVIGRYTVVPGMHSHFLFYISKER